MAGIARDSSYLLERDGSHLQGHSRDISCPLLPDGSVNTAGPADASIAPAGEGTLLGSVANVANCALGAGVLAFPFAVKCTGLLFSPVVFIVCAMLLGKSLHILALAAEASGAPTYQAALRLVLGGRLGERCEFILETTVYVYVIGCGVAFLNVVSDSLTAAGVLGSSWFATERWHLLLAYAGCILLPLCLVRRIQSFSFTSTFAIFSIVYMIAVVVRYSLLEAAFGERSAEIGHNGTSVAPRTIRLFNWGGEVFKALPVVCFAFNCHLAFIPLYHELSRRYARPGPRPRSRRVRTPSASPPT